MIVLDASVLIAFLNERDAQHREAFELMMGADRYPMHAITVAEALVRWAREGRLVEAEQRLVELGVVQHQQIVREGARLAELRAATGLKLPDCCPLMLAELGAWPLVTFDHRLASAARSRGIEVLDAG